MHFKLIWNPLSALIPLYSLQSVHLGSVVREAETSQWEKRIIDKWPMRVLDTCLLTGALREEKHSINLVSPRVMSAGCLSWPIRGLAWWHLTNERPGRWHNETRRDIACLGKGWQFVNGSDWFVTAEGYLLPQTRQGNTRSHLREFRLFSFNIQYPQ